MLFMGKSTISMAICNCYVSSPEGTINFSIINALITFIYTPKYLEYKLYNH